MKGISTRDTYKYICKCDRDQPKEDQTVFTLGYLDIEQEADLDDKLGCVTDNGYQVAIGSTALLALHYGLREIENLPLGNDMVELVRDETKSNKTLKGKLRPWKLSCLSAIRKEERTELAEVIRNGGELSEEERKNS